MSSCLISQVSNLAKNGNSTLSRKRSVRCCLGDEGCFTDAGEICAPYGAQFSFVSKKNERLVLNDVLFLFHGELLSIGSVRLPNTDKSVGVSFPVVNLDSDQMCSSCREFFLKYSRSNTISYLNKAGMQLESDGHVYVLPMTSEKDARQTIMKYFLLIFRDIKSLHKLCFDYYIGSFCNEREKSGEGIFGTRSGYTYRGSFNLNHFNGYGSLSSTDCIHRGYFQTSSITGLGEVIDFKNHYFGEMDHGYASGLGSKEDGTRCFKGQFEKGRIHGSFLSIPERKKIIFGQYKNGYSYHVESSSSIEACFISNVPQGSCVQTNEFGSLYIGNVHDGKLHGKGISMHPLTRTILIGTWKNGVWEGN